MVLAFRLHGSAQAQRFSRTLVSRRDAATGQGRVWFRDLDSNQDSQLQRLMCYRLHYPGTAGNSLAEEKECAKSQKCARTESFC
jgi:hypothetical protein